MSIREEHANVFKPLIKSGAYGAYYVLVSHSELDWLIAELMHLAELDSDKEHREAIKGEIKLRSRKWLDNLYVDAGYVNHELVARAKVINVTDLETTN